MTQPELDHDYSDIRDAVAKLCAQFPGEYWRKADRPMAYPAGFVNRLTEPGSPPVAIPQEYCGAGLKPSAATAIPEKIPRTRCNARACPAPIYNKGTVPRPGRKEQKGKWLPQI